MSKLFVRLTIIGVALYLIACYIVPLVCAVDIWSQSYWLLFEFCVCLCVSKQGCYHCKYIRWTAYAILVADTLVCIDNIFDVFPVNCMVFAPAAIIAVGLIITTALALNHYRQVRRIKRIWRKK